MTQFDHCRRRLEALNSQHRFSVHRGPAYWSELSEIRDLLTPHGLHLIQDWHARGLLWIVSSVLEPK